MWRWVMLFVIFLIVTYCSVRPAHATTYVPQDDTLGEMANYTVKEEDNLYDIARRHDLGIVELLAANPNVDVWQPEPGTELKLTTMHMLPPVHRGIVLNLPELRLFYFMDDGRVMTFPIGIGREGWRTPLGIAKILRKRQHPIWTPPPSIRTESPDLPEAIPTGPENPLGDYALDLNIVGVLIHGTNRPYGIGKRSSHGCIRLYPEDIEQLFHAVSVGTKVTIIDAPYKLGWRGDTLLLEVTPTQEQSDIIAEYRKPHPVSIPEIYSAIDKITDKRSDIDWHEVEEAIARRDGLPVVIAKRAP